MIAYCDFVYKSGHRSKRMIDTDQDHFVAVYERDNGECTVLFRFERKLVAVAPGRAGDAGLYRIEYHEQ